MRIVRPLERSWISSARRFALPAALLLVVALAGCVISPRRDSTTTGGGGTGNFTLSISPGTQSLAPGAQGTYTITVTGTNGNTDSIALSASGVPSTVQATFSTSSVTGGSGTSTLTVVVSSSATPGTSTIVITGTDATTSGTQKVNATLTIM